MTTEKKMVLKRLKIAIIVLLVIFTISSIVLAGRIVYVSFFTDRQTTAIVPDNVFGEIDGGISVEPIPLILENNEETVGSDVVLSDVLCAKPSGAYLAPLASRATQATLIEIYKGQSTDKDNFDVENMFPGDVEIKNFRIHVYHKADVAIFFSVSDIVDGYNESHIQNRLPLSGMLRIKVSVTFAEQETVLCEGTFAEIAELTRDDAERGVFVVFPANAANFTEADYRIEVSLPTSAGNEYQRTTLKATFNWYSNTPPVHYCSQPCPVDGCGKCLDKECTDPVCADKCPGHSQPPPPPPPPPAHVCESKCPTCGRCLDKECTFPVCAEKCKGHDTTPIHTCANPCPTCGKCTNEKCEHLVCVDKCQGHDTTPEHVCESKCPVCEKCLDMECTFPVCAEKCQGHGTGPEHDCESKCPICGKCLDMECTFPVCAEKCQGHTGPDHECESKCPICEKCLDMECTFPDCAEKCPGHTAPGHVCENECPICEKCLDPDCTEEVCKEKCPGHVVPPAHECESKCRVCGWCLDKSCTEDACKNKCPGHEDPLVPKPEK